MRRILIGAVIAIGCTGCGEDPADDGGVDAGDGDIDADVDGDGDADSDGDADADGDSDGDADGDADGDSEIETNADELIELYYPEPDSVAWRNAVVTLVFINEIDADTLLVEINDEPVDMHTVDDQEFRFVPLPLFETDSEYSVTVAAGLVDVLDNELDGDFTWVFRSSADEIDVTGDPELLPDEVDLIMSGEADEPLDLVQDWDDPFSTLYDISPPLDPSSADVGHLIERMMVSVVYHGGIGLAAPQVGVNRRLFVADVGEGFEVFMNPVLSLHADELDVMAEGCLSVPGERLVVYRPSWVEVDYDGEDGAHIDDRYLENPEGSLFDYPARVWLHEFDHLNGILITDRASTR